MLLILGLILFSPVHSQPVDPTSLLDPETAAPESLLIPSLERLTKVLPENVVKYPQFHSDFYTESGRRNISVTSYANTCFDSYVALKLSPAETGIWSELSGLFGLMPLDTNITEVLDETEYAIVALISEGRYMVSGADTNTFTTLASKIAIRYKKLSAETKKDLEKTLCIRNTIQWFNSTIPAGYHSPMFERFSEMVGLNIDQLLENSPYLLSLPIEKVKNAYSWRARNVNLDAQDYVDTCAESIKAYENSTNIDPRAGERVMNIAKEKFAQLPPNTRALLNLTRIKTELSDAFLTVYSRRNERKTDAIQVFSDETIANLEASQRELERVYCTKGVLENAFGGVISDVVNFNITM